MEISKSFNTNLSIPLQVEDAKEMKKHLQKTELPTELLTSHEPISPKHLRDLVEDANDFFRMTETQIQFHLHEGLEKYYVSVVDAHTEEVIREIPPEKMLDMYAAMRELVGIMVDRKL